MSDDMSETTELKPCPFCNSTIYVRLRQKPTEHGMRWVYCSNCLTDGPPEPTDETAIAAWNTRADNALAAEVAALRQQNAALSAIIGGLECFNAVESGKSCETLEKQFGGWTYCQACTAKARAKHGKAATAKAINDLRAALRNGGEK